MSEGSAMREIPVLSECCPGRYRAVFPFRLGSLELGVIGFCGLEEGDYHLDAASPVFTPPHASCPPGGMGALGARCGDAPDLYFSRVEFETFRAEAGSAIGVTAVVRNGGTQPAPEFAVHFAADLDLPPVPGETWLTYTVEGGLAAGESAAWEFAITSPEPATWGSWLSIDPEHAVPELDRDNNVLGPMIVTWTQPEQVESSTGLREIRPNPFAASTRIEYELSGTRSVRIEIYDVSGRRVKIWKLPPMGPGFHAVEWDGADDDGRQLAAGVYFCRFTAGGFEQAEKIVLIR